MGLTVGASLLAAFLAVVVICAGSLPEEQPGKGAWLGNADKAHVAAFCTSTARRVGSTRGRAFTTAAVVVSDRPVAVGMVPS